MADTILIKRSLTSGSIPSTSSLEVGELAINVPDAKLFLKQSGSNVETIRSLLTLDAPMSGNILLTGSITLSPNRVVQATAFSGSLFGTASAANSITFIPATASFATSASFAPTILPAGTVSSSTQINTGSFSGSFSGTFTGTSSFATSASRAITASFVLPSGLPSGVVSSSAQVVSSLPTGTVSSSAQINTGSFSGSFIGTLVGTGSWASNAVSSSFATTASAATSITFTPATASFATSASYAPTILPSGVVSSSAQINTGSFSGSFIGTGSWALNAVSASFATTASAATSITFTPSTASFAITASYVSGAASTWDSISNKPSGLVSSSTQATTWTVATASYVSGGVVIIGTPTDGAYGGSAGNVSGISSGDKAEDAFDKIEVILGRLAPAKPANLSTRTLTTNATVYTAFTASGATPTLFGNVTTNARPTASWTFVAATSGSGSTLSFDADSGILQAEVDGVVTVASQDSLTTASDVGTFGNLIITTDSDPYGGTFGQQGFWKGFIASVAPTASLALGPHNARLIHSTTGATPLFSWSLDNPTTPSITSITGSSAGGTTRYVSGVPTLATGETVVILVTGSNAVSQFYNQTRIFSAVGNNSVASSVNATLPASPPVSASTTSASITLTIASNAYTTASTYTGTIFNSAGTSGTSTWVPPTSIRVDTISNESARCRSGIGWYPSINGTVSGAGAIWTASANLTGSRELQMTNNVYHYPSSSNYTANYPLAGPDYRGLVAETTSSFPSEAVRWVTFSGSLSAASNVSVAFNNTNAAFVGIQTTGSMRLYVLVSGSSPTTGWIDGATAYPGTGNPINNGDPALVVGSSTATTKIITFGGSVKTGTVFVRVGIPSSSLAGSTRTFSGVTITQV
jgi:hypothetical protein